MNVLILMATYRGALYLREQVESIQEQTHTDWHLLVRDDGSDDGTRELLNELAAQDARIELLEDDLGHLGAVGSFARLLDESASRSEPYVAVADQDDQWVGKKLAMQLKSIRCMEHEHGAVTPCLVHSDLAVTDEHMQQINYSFVRYQGIHWPNNPRLGCCLVQNHVVGCTILANRALISLVTPIPIGIHMHDWWISVCGHAFGKVTFLPTPLVHYRQHDQNRIGASGIWGLLSRPERWIHWLAKMNCLYRYSSFQAGLILDRWPDSDRSNGREPLVAMFASLPGLSRFKRLRALQKNRIHTQHPLLTLLFYLQALLIDGNRYAPRGDASDGCRESHR